jgi:protein-tyrosine-phosphatase/DNA-binding transcriptional ArsR family regulator
MVHQLKLIYLGGVGDLDPPEFPELLRLAGHQVRWALMSELAGSDLRVRELVERVGEPQSLVSYHLRVLRDGGLVRRHPSSFDGRDSYYELDLDRCAAGLAGIGSALHPSLSRSPGPRPPASPSPVPSSTAVPSVMFVCTGNSARSPMAEVLLRERGHGRVRTTSGGTRPRESVDPHAIRVMGARHGLDLGAHVPRPVAVLERFDCVVTLCDKAREALVKVDTPRLVHWSVPDPGVGTGPESLRAFEQTADEIDDRVRHLLPTLLEATRDPGPARPGHIRSEERS